MKHELQFWDSGHPWWGDIKLRLQDTIVFNVVVYDYKNLVIVEKHHIHYPNNLRGYSYRRFEL